MHPMFSENRLIKPENNIIMKRFISERMNRQSKRKKKDYKEMRMKMIDKIIARTEGNNLAQSVALKANPKHGSNTKRSGLLAN